MFADEREERGVEVEILFGQRGAPIYGVLIGALLRPDALTDLCSTSPPF
jgi:hypothetical protein